jgi:hypothetical protein
MRIASFTFVVLTQKHLIRRIAMLKTLVSLVVMSVALLTSSMAFASPAPVDDESFLASLQAPQAATAPEAPALTSADRTPAPVPMACSFSCQSCSVNGMVGKQLCTTCNGVKSCGSCAMLCSF